MQKYPDRAFHMMTPGGYVDLASKQVKALLDGQGVKTHPGVSGYDMEMDAEELLNEKVHSVRLEKGAFYLITDYVSGQEEQGEEPQGLREVEENMENERKLKERLKANYEEYIRQLGQKPAEELIEMASEIAAAKFIYGELMAEGASREYADYLLQFENPLEVLRNGWQEYEEFRHRDKELEQVLWSMKDMGTGIGDYPMAEQAGESTQGQGVVMC